MTDNKSTGFSANFVKKSITYFFLHIYLGIIMFVVSYFIYFGPKAGTPIAIFFSGLGLGLGITMIGTGVLGLKSFCLTPNMRGAVTFASAQCDC